MTEADELLPVTEAARLLGVSASSLRNYEKQRLIVSHRTPGGHRRFRRGDVEALVDAGSRRLAENEAAKLPGKTLAESLGIVVPEGAPGGSGIAAAPTRGRAGRVGHPDPDVDYEGFRDPDGWR
jgi:excisionase family DNA binding protein